MEKQKIAAGLVALSCSVASGTLLADTGTDVQKLMTYYYNRTLTSDCGNGRPAMKCSGLFLRGTDSGKSFEPWDVSPASKKSGGVSMSYLRRDIHYDGLGLGKYNGFVLPPDDYAQWVVDAPRKTDVLCFFPLDAWTDMRAAAGCGDSRNTPYVEQACQDLKITRGEKWLEDFKNTAAKNTGTASTASHQAQCGFRLNESKADVKAFRAAIEARRLAEEDPATSADAYRTQTEVRVRAWDDDLDNRLPIIAFMYTEQRGIQLAQADQERFYKATQRWVPVIKVTLPTSVKTNATFAYNPTDQKVAAPAVENDCSQYIADANWVSRSEPRRHIYTHGGDEKIDVMSLQVTPTACARKMTSDQQVLAAYAELFNAHYSDSDWGRDRPSMWRQFRCHVEWRGKDNQGNEISALNKTTWNLEPLRPSASRQEMLDAGCNVTRKK